MKPSEVLQKRGWYQGDFESEDGKVCLSMAITLSIYDYEQEIAFNKKVKEFLWNVHPQHGHTCIASFNDCPEMTEDTILRATKHAEQEVLNETL